jgi:outer membrane protein OmpA-like peptidoglycan-associated protein
VKRPLASPAPAARTEVPLPPREAPPQPSPAADFIARLQQTAGNAAVARMLQREPAPAATCSPADQAKLDELLSTTYTTEDFHPSTGRGLFDAVYAPGDGNLTITVGITFNFVDGNPSDPTWLATVGPANAAHYTADQFRWTDDEKTQWKENAISTVTALWSHRYTFFTQKDCWAAQLPPVNVNTEIVERPASGVNKSHFVTTVNKWPTEPGLEESVTPPGATADQSTARFQESADDGITNPDSTHFDRDTHTRARYGQVDRDNPGTISFPVGSSTVSDADKARLQTFGRTLGAPDMPPFPTTVTGHSSSDGSADRNQTLSEDRARNVSNEIVNAGAQRQPQINAVGATGAAPTPEWRRVDITVGDFEADQTTVAHEFGHMLGLGDEYPTLDGGTRDVGTPVAHSALAQSLIPGQQPILAHHSDNIMSNGETVQPYHYVTFLEVLGTMSGTTGTWDIRPAAASGPTDAPLPANDGTAVA